MRLLPLFITLLLVAACGKDGGSSSALPKTGDAQMEEDATPTCALESCNTITADGSTVDLLDSVIDVPAQVTDSQITFTGSKIAVSDGDRISCKTEVRAGEVYQLSLTGNTLMVQTPTGQYSMVRLNEGGSGVKGAWMWKGRGEDGMHMIRTMSVVSNTRVILKTHCEM